MNYWPATCRTAAPLSVLFCTALFANKATAQQLLLETGSNVLVLQADTAGHLHMNYLGKKLQHKQEYAMLQAMYRQGTDYSGTLDAAYTSAGTTSLAEPAITVVHADGNRSLDLQYVSHRLERLNENVSVLSVDLKDSVYAFQVTLYYKAYYKEDIIEQWSAIVQKEAGSVLLEKYASANLYLKAGSFYLTQYQSDWAREMQPETALLTHGIKTLDTKPGTRANLFQPSVFMVSLNKSAMMLCAGGGGRVDYAALQYFTGYWPSDNTGRCIRVIF